MFSPAERRYLESIAAGSRSARTRAIPSGLSAGYRRKLRWGIRRKADRAYSDWSLYVAAAREEARLLPPTRDSEGPPPPVFADPLVRVVGELRRRLDRPPSRRSGRPRSPTRGT